MGRNYTFNGIFDQNDINTLSPIYSEHDSKGKEITFFEINWQIHKSRNVKYLY